MWLVSNKVEECTKKKKLALPIVVWMHINVKPESLSLILGLKFFKSFRNDF